MPDFDILSADECDLDLAGTFALPNEFSGATDTGMPTSKDQDAGPDHEPKARRSAVFAA
jgi:hypothetical protein